MGWVAGQLVLATACGAGSSHVLREDGTPPAAVAELTARQRWDALREAYLAEHQPPLSENELDANETESEEGEEVLEPRCREREVGTVIIGTCGVGNERGYEDYAGWIVADEGVAWLEEEAEVIVAVDNGDITYELTRPSLDRDPHEGLALLSHFANRALGVVTVGPHGPEYVSIASPDTMAIAETPCGAALLETPTEEGSPIRIIVARSAAGGFAVDRACIDALQDIATRAEASSFAARQALIDAIAASTPSAPPGCVSPSEADLRRGRRLVLAALADELSDAAGSREEEDDDEEDREDWRDPEAPPLTRAGIDAALASATTGCLDAASGSYFLTLESTELEYAAVWEIGRSGASAVTVARIRDGDESATRFAAVTSVELFGNGAPELVVRTTESMSDGDEGTARYPELSRRTTERAAMREGLLAVRALIPTTASDEWFPAMLAALVHAGVAEAEARHLVEAAHALIRREATR